MEKKRDIKSSTEEDKNPNTYQFFEGEVFVNTRRGERNLSFYVYGRSALEAERKVLQYIDDHPNQGVPDINTIQLNHCNPEKYFFKRKELNEYGLINMRFEYVVI